MPRPEFATEHIVEQLPHRGLGLRIGFKVIGYPRRDAKFVNRGNVTFQTKDSQ